MGPFISSDITLNQNIDYAETDIYDPFGVVVDLSTYTASMMIRVNPTDVTPQLSLTNTFVTGLGITLTSAGLVTPTIPKAQINLLLPKIPGLVANFSVILTDGTGKNILFKSGAVILIRGATY